MPSSIPEKSCFLKAYGKFLRAKVVAQDAGQRVNRSDQQCANQQQNHHAINTQLRYGSIDDLWPVLRHEALSDGIMDAALLARFETAVRPKEFYWGEWYDGQMLKATTALDVLETEVDTINDAAMGAIAIACALSYLDLRYPDLGWETAHPSLAAWYAAYSKRPAMIAANAVANPA